MASSSSCPSTSAISSRSWKYHVFLNFRGEDTRKTFVDHLYSALDREGIHTYKDDETLPRGESIGPALMTAIEESQIAIIVFSRNYADSSWCLDELVHIMKCKDTRGQIVMPIFYDVDPSEVRKLKRKYGEAFAKHELENNNKIKSWRQAFLDDPWGWLSAPLEQKRKYQEACTKHELENNEKVESWRKALVDASNISGWEPKHVANGRESKVIKEIVYSISQNLKLPTSSENKNMIGLAARMQRLKSELQIGSDGVRMIGIWGVGGGGKTTLASSIYDEISSEFDGSCFVKNIREESSKIGLEKLQEKILYVVLKQNQPKEIERVEEGRRKILDRLRQIKVLIVLDDVDRLEQLKALAGSHDWFREGSRIIITTRDEHLLTSHRVDVMHHISLLNDCEAINLFRTLSPQDNRRTEDYERLSRDVVSYASGLPLALTVLGYFLCDKDIHECMSALSRLKKTPDVDIVETLKISFDGLKPVEKDLFLDIACFYRGKDKDKAMEILDACGFDAVIGVKVLIQKALITISDGMFDMHDLIQEMGHYIVRGEHPKNPEKHSRVWKIEDVRKICAMDATMELDKIEAITTYYNSIQGQDLPPIVANMKNLRCIWWKGDSASPLLSKFSQPELCSLKLHEGLQKQLWKGYKHLPNLKIMKLGRMHNLLTTPDFDGLPNLERFRLHGCRSLEEIHPSIGRLESLVFLSVKYCPNLKMFPSISRLKKLETLILLWCPKLINLSQQNSENLPHLDLPRGLRKLDLCYCNVGDREIGSSVIELPKLEEVNLSGNKFSRLNFSFLRLPQLKWLNVSYCKALVQLSNLPSNIAVVKADHCISLENFGDISNCKWLWKVSLMGNNKLGPLVSDIILDSAIKDHFTSVTLGCHKTPKRFLGRLFRGKTFTLHLPHGWYNDFCGFLICCVTDINYPHFNMIIKQEVDEDSRSEIWQESSEAMEPEYDGKAKTYLGYISFSSLMHTTLLGSSYNIILFSIDNMGWTLYGDETYVGGELVPRRSKGDEVQTTEFWVKKYEDGQHTFTIQHDSESSINILWRPLYYTQKVVMKVDVHNVEEKKKALKIVSSLSGVKSIRMDMEDKKLMVIGDVDPVDIIEKLKKCWHTEIVTIAQVKEKMVNEDEAIRRLVEAYKTYNPTMTQHYYVTSVEENPNACVIC